MGCDIHIVLERYWNGQWVGLSPNTLPNDRNYKRFAMLANVRGSGPEAKGLPDDASPLAEMNHEGWGMDAHSASWEMLRDFVRVCLESEYDPENVFLKPGDKRGEAPYEHYFGLYFDDSTEKIDDYRVVFWFDN
jgi:hypothetical protein